MHYREKGWRPMILVLASWPVVSIGPLRSMSNGTQAGRGYLFRPPFA